MAIALSKENRQQAVESIRRYWREQLDDDVGDLKAGLLLDFFLREVGPCVYNQAIKDAQAYFQDKVADLEGVRYEREFGYWD